MHHVVVVQICNEFTTSLGETRIASSARTSMLFPAEDSDARVGERAQHIGSVILARIVYNEELPMAVRLRDHGSSRALNEIGTVMSRQHHRDQCMVGNGHMPQIRRCRPRR
jgi:hypothetical protein